MEKDEVIAKTAEFLRHHVSRTGQVSLRYVLIAMTIGEANTNELAEQIKENIDEAAAQADVEIVEKDDKRALFQHRRSVPPPKERTMEER